MAQGAVILIDYPGGHKELAFEGPSPEGSVIFVTAPPSSPPHAFVFSSLFSWWVRAGAAANAKWRLGRGGGLLRAVGGEVCSAVVVD
jgi:hypothetical protein